MKNVEDNQFQVNKENLKSAMLEAIYWWNRTEGYYHKYFCQLDELIKYEDEFNFFITKVFKVFLNEYSVRRNIASGDKNVRDFVEKLIDSEFYQDVKSNKLEAIDYFSTKFRDTCELTNGKHSRSLLSKIAFLINPHKFVLIDTFARQSLWNFVKNDTQIRGQDLECYNVFLSVLKCFIRRYEDTFKNANSELENFRGTDAHTFFSVNNEAFKLRVFDKLLWLNTAREKNIMIDNSGYRKFLSFPPKS